MTKPIEMIGTMILNGGQDLLDHYNSIDYPVNRYFVIDNSMGKDPSVTKVLKELTELFSTNLPVARNKNIKEICVVKNNLNQGFSGSVNQIVKQNTDCPYWCVFSVDWHLKPGELAKLARRLEKPFTGILCDETQNGYSAMVFGPGLIQNVGLMDENFFPAYYEDNDHRYRMKLAGLQWEYFPLKYSHKVSSTLKRDDNFKIKNQYTFQQNRKYYLEKWGGLPGQEKFETPFDMDLTCDYWLYDPTRSQRQRWI